MKRKLSPKSIWDQGDLEQTFQDNGFKLIHMSLVWKAIHKHNITDLDDLDAAATGLPKRLVEVLKKEYTIATSSVVLDKEIFSSEAFEGKLVIKLQDGQLIETVIIQSDNKSQRLTVCVSSQVGCKMGCTFCETGTMGLLSQLTAGEIAEQVWHVNQQLSTTLKGSTRRTLKGSTRRSSVSSTASVSESITEDRIEKLVSNVVFMGMGEPLDNYYSVLDSVKVMSNPHAYAIAPSKITLSTVGVVSRIKQLAVDNPKVRLALSLHAPNQELRMKIVPSTKAFSVRKLVEACDYYSSISGGNVIMIEYICIGGVNDTAEVAHELGQLLTGKAMWVNLIPYNPTDAGDRFGFKSPVNADLQVFADIMKTYTSKYGKPIKCIVRWSTERGREVDGACGQLALKNLENDLDRKAAADDSKMAGGEKKSITDIEDLLDGNKGGSGPAFNTEAKVKRRQKGRIDFKSSLQQVNGDGDGASDPLGGENVINSVGVSLGSFFENQHMKFAVTLTLVSAVYFTLKYYLKRG